MRTGYMMIFQNHHPGLSDAEMVRAEMRLAEQAEPLGFDILWSPEHHFDDYSMAPDNLQVLTWLGAKTQKIRLGAAAVILPWNHPIRVVEKIAMLDALANDRFVLGMGRGLARMEYEAFGIPMSEARERFNEASKMIVDALTTGFIEGKGPHYPQKRTEIRPRPSKSWRDRLYAVAMSPESAPIVGDLGARMMFFVQFSIDKHLPGIESYRESFRKAHPGATAPPVHAIDFSYCDRDAGRAEERARKYIGGYYASVLKHYEFLEDYHKRVKGYESYGMAAEFLKAMGLEGAADDFVKQQCWGTPQRILEKLEARRKVIGDFEWNVCTSYAGLPFDEAQTSMTLIAKEVLPEVKSWGEDSFEPLRKSA